jgi:hypothetical protein
VRGKTAKLLRQRLREINAIAPRPMRLKALKRRWMETPSPDRHGMIVRLIEAVYRLRASLDAKVEAGRGA